MSSVDEQSEPRRVRIADAPGFCLYCDQHRFDKMVPPHTPSKNCESGKRPHCTCDACF